jgi:ATP-dependent Lhr-like helicase
VEGRWTLLPAAAGPIDEPDELAEAIAWQLLRRWGVVFRDVYLKERLAIPWREILWALRRLEARGLIRGGHFVTGVTGEQFAEEATIPFLRPRRAAGAA